MSAQVRQNRSALAKMPAVRPSSRMSTQGSLFAKVVDAVPSLSKSMARHAIGEGPICAQIPAWVSGLKFHESAETLAYQPVKGDLENRRVSTGFR